jgi:diacylglycerol kinase (ATP)
VPVGSGNDFAHALGINSVEDAISVWRQFCCGAKNLKAIDVGVIRSAKTSESGQLETGNSKLETYFCNIAGVGLDCEANRRANAMPRWLRAQGGYILAALSAIAVSSPTVVTVSTETSTISEAAMLVAIANTTSYGGGMRIAPRAQLADGLLDICFVRRTSGMRLLWNFPRVFRGEHLALPEVEYLQARQLRIASERPMDLYADGEFVCRTPVEIEVVPQALRVISPLT